MRATKNRPRQAFHSSVMPRVEKVNGTLENPVKVERKWKLPEQARPFMFKKGQSGNPAGRPKGQSLKEYARQWYLEKSPEEKRAYLERLEEVMPGFAWRMAEGNPHNSADITSAGAPTPILYGLISPQEKAQDAPALPEPPATP